MAKDYIDVNAFFDTSGNMVPLSFCWHSKIYDVDKVIDIRRSAAWIGGGLGIRYTCRILGKDRHLFFDDYTNRWFVEYCEYNAVF